MKTTETDYNCPVWMRFLDDATRGDADAMAQLQEFAGTCLVPERIWGKALALSGPGKGKTTFMRVLCEMVGRENTSTVSLSDMENDFYRGDLKGKWLNIAPLEQFGLEHHYFKGVVTGDPMNASIKHGDCFAFQPTCKLVFETRDLRVINPRCLSVFFGYHPRNSNSDLFQALQHEMDEIRKWAMAGLDRLDAQGDFTAYRLMIPVANESPYAIVRQPNGNHALFCRETNSFSMINSSVEDIRDNLIHKEAERVYSEIVDPFYYRTDGTEFEEDPLWSDAISEIDKAGLSVFNEERIQDMKRPIRISRPKYQPYR